MFYKTFVAYNEIALCEQQKHSVNASKNIRKVEDKQALNVRFTFESKHK